MEKFKFLKNPIMSNKDASICKKIQQNSNIVKYYYNLK